MFEHKYNRLMQEMAALKEDMKTLNMAGEQDAMWELFVRETRRMLGKTPELPKDFSNRKAEQIMKDLGLK